MNKITVYLLLISTLCFVEIYVLAQTTAPPDVEMTARRNPNNEMVFSATKYRPGSYVVVVALSDVQNAVPTPLIHKKSLKKSGPILALRPLDKQFEATAKYNYWFAQACVDAKPDTTFIYRLPYSTAKQDVKAQYTYNALSNSDDVKNWSSICFELTKGDTIYAARRGTVIRIINETDNIVPGTSIRIEHGDGTIASYAPVQSGTLLVSEGDVVYPNTPLAVIGVSNQNMYQLHLQTFYSDLGHVVKEPVTYSLINTYFNPIFATRNSNTKLEDESINIAVVLPSLINKEISTKELKEIQKALKAK